MEIKNNRKKIVFWGKTPVLGLAVVLISSAVIVGSRLAGNNESPTLSNAPTRGEETVSSIIQSGEKASVTAQIPGWETFSSLDDPIFASVVKNFSFLYPPELLLDHAGGTGGTYVTFFTGGFELAITSIDSATSTSDMATEFISSSIEKVKNADNCAAYPKLCDERNYVSFSEKLANDLAAEVAKGPSDNTKIFENYFIQLGSNYVLNMNFSYEDTEKWRTTKKKIISSLQINP
jgi:hypothetical protein